MKHVAKTSFPNGNAENSLIDYLIKNLFKKHQIEYLEHQSKLVGLQTDMEIKKYNVLDRQSNLDKIYSELNLNNDKHRLEVLKHETEKQLNLLKHLLEEKKHRFEIDKFDLEWGKYSLEREKHIKESSLNLLKHELEKNKTEAEMMREFLKVKADINKIYIESSQEDIKAGLMQKAVNNFDDLPQALQVYVMRSVFNPKDNQDNDILLQDELRQYLKQEKESLSEKARADAEYRKEEARQQAVKTKHEEWKHQKARGRE